MAPKLYLNKAIFNKICVMLTNKNTDSRVNLPRLEPVLSYLSVMKP